MNYLRCRCHLSFLDVSPQIIQQKKPGKRVSIFSPSQAFKKNFHDFLLSIMEAEDDYVEVPTLLQKMANSVSLTQCTNNQ